MKQRRISFLVDEHVYEWLKWVGKTDHGFNPFFTGSPEAIAKQLMIEGLRPFVFMGSVVKSVEEEVDFVRKETTKLLRAGK